METYPKPKAHPSSSIGEQTMKDSWKGDSSCCSYPNNGIAKSLNTHRNKVLVSSGSSASAPGDDYPGEWSHSKQFGTVKLQGR